MDDNQEIIPPATDASTRSPWTKRLAIGGVALAVLAGAGAIAATASDMRGSGPHHAMGMGAEHASWRGGMGFGGHGMGRMLDRIDATDEQRDKIEEIFDSVRGEVRPLMREFRDARKDLSELLAAPTIDRAAVEKLRADRLAAVDQASQKMTTALLDAAAVLTPEQRKELMEHFEDRGGKRRW